jgi:hypothetical protein
VVPFGQMMHGSSTSVAGVDDVTKTPRINPITSTIATNTSPIKNHFPLMFLHLQAEVVPGHELRSESSAFPGAEA